MDICLNPQLMRIFSNYFGLNPILRSYPCLQYVDKSSEDRNAKDIEKVAHGWHIDTVSIMPFMIYSFPT